MMSEEEEICCDWCGGEVFDESDLELGKCQMCRVNDCNHYNRDVASYDLQIYDKELTLHMVCMDCEICWEIKHHLSQGIKSKYHHEDLNASDIND